MFSPFRTNYRPAYSFKSPPPRMAHIITHWQPLLLIVVQLNLAITQETSSCFQRCGLDGYETDVKQVLAALADQVARQVTDQVARLFTDQVAVGLRLLNGRIDRQQSLVEKIDERITSVLDNISNNAEKLDLLLAKSGHQEELLQNLTHHDVDMEHRRYQEYHKLTNGLNNLATAELEAVYRTEQLNERITTKMNNISEVLEVMPVMVNKIEACMNITSLNGRLGDRLETVVATLQHNVTEYFSHLNSQLFFKNMKLKNVIKDMAYYQKHREDF